MMSQSYEKITETAQVEAVQNIAKALIRYEGTMSAERRQRYNSVFDCKGDSITYFKLGLSLLPIRQTRNAYLKHGKLTIAVPRIWDLNTVSSLISQGDEVDVVGDSAVADELTDGMRLKLIDTRLNSLHMMMETHLNRDSRSESHSSSSSFTGFHVGPYARQEEATEPDEVLDTTTSFPNGATPDSPIEAEVKEVAGSEGEEAEASEGEEAEASKGEEAEAGEGEAGAGA